MDRHFESTFHKVGQGLFYSLDTADFHMVYDCGSQDPSASIREAQDHRSKIGDHIDMLVISHFHEDHINGLEELLKNATVDTIILPYLFPLERLTLALQFPGAQQWVHDFLTHPIRTLLDTVEKVNYIYVIGAPPDELGPEQDPPDRDYPPDNNQEPIENDIHQLPIDERTLITIQQDPGYRDKRLKAKCLKYFGWFTTKHIWEFKYFNIPWDQHQIDALKQCLQTSNVDPNDKDDILEHIKDPTKRAKIGACYPISQEPRNNTSIIMYHGPINHKRLLEQARPFWPHYPFPYFWSLFEIEDWGHLLTGDINLNRGSGVNKYSHEIVAHFSSRKDRIYIALAPHHGSDHNWHDALLKSLSSCGSWVASAKSTSLYHPGRTVVRDIAANGRVFYLCHEGQEIVFRARIEY